MKKSDTRKFKAVKNFIDEIDETKKLIEALNVQIISTKTLIEKFEFSKKPGYSKHKPLLEISEQQVSSLYELGFIKLFANFEAFSCEFLKELYRRYPSSYRSEKSIKYEEIREFDNIQEVKDYFIDSLAILKSYEIDTWNSVLKNQFQIDFFKNKKNLIKHKALNSLRNIMLHSGGLTNSKFRNEMRPLLKTPVPIGEKFDLDRKQYFYILYRHLNNLAKKV